MEYQKILDTSGLYTIQDCLLAMKAGYHCSRLGPSLKENILELKWNRNASAQRLVLGLVEMVSDEDVVLISAKQIG